MRIARDGEVPSISLGPSHSSEAVNTMLSHQADSRSLEPSPPRSLVLLQLVLSFAVLLSFGDPVGWRLTELIERSSVTFLNHRPLLLNVVQVFCPYISALVVSAVIVFSFKLHQRTSVPMPGAKIIAAGLLAFCVHFIVWFVAYAMAGSAYSMLVLFLSADIAYGAALILVVGLLRFLLQFRPAKPDVA
jgi:hypothetical protein